MSAGKKKLQAVEAAAPGMARLRALLQVLRGPGGCPWDQEQTHRSLAPYLLEETYEVLEALDADDPAQLREELGDLLLQIVFHAQLAEEAGKFDLETVAELEVKKMVERHPHVFATETAETAGDVRDQWEARKRKKSKRSSLADGVPKALPALTRAQTISARAASLGFDWLDATETWGKVEEEHAELKQLLAKEAPASHTTEAIEEEIGDLLLALVNLARKLGLDSEAALRRAVDKFVTRFDRMERQEKPRESGSNVAQDWDEAWQKAKQPLSSAEDASS